MQAFGYSTETMQFMLLPLVNEKRDPVGSMGNDSALAVLSDQPRMLYDYFKQLFAQVTNPPIDSIREEVIMSLECYIGPERNLLATTEQHAHRLLLPHPILTNEELAALKHLDHRGWKSKLIDITYDRSGGRGGPDASGSTASATRPSRRSTDGYSLVVLSDRGVSAERVPVSSLLAVGAVHHHLIRQAKRTRIGIILESGEAREVHHHCLLVGYGADAINPYLAFEALWQAQRDGLLPADYSDEKIVHALSKGGGQGHAQGDVARWASRRCSRTRGRRSSRRSASNDEVIDKCFAGTASRIKGVGFEVLAKEALRRHEIGYPAAGRAAAARAAELRRVPLAGRRRAAHVGPAVDRRPASGRPREQRRRLLAVRASTPTKTRPASAPSAACSSSRKASTGRFRSRRSSRPRRSSSGSAPAR